LEDLKPDMCEVEYEDNVREMTCIERRVVSIVVRLLDDVST